MFQIQFVLQLFIGIFLSLFIFQPKSFIGTWSQVGDHATLTGQWRKLSLTGNAFRVPTTQFLCVCQRLPREQSCGVQIQSTEDALLKVAQQFEGMWIFLHCCRAFNGKHIAIQNPSSRHAFCFPLWRCLVWSLHIAQGML